MKTQTLTQYGRMAETHWRACLPKMVAELESTNRLQAMLQEAENKTEDQLDQLRRHFIQQGLTPQQAHDQAWEIVRQRYIFLPPEQ
jgi:ferritin-like metal-binding protein YciE